MTSFNGEHNAGVQVLSTRNFAPGDGPLGQIGAEPGRCERWRGGRRGGRRDAHPAVARLAKNPGFLGISYLGSACTRLGTDPMD